MVKDREYDPVTGPVPGVDQEARKRELEEIGKQGDYVPPKVEVTTNKTKKPKIELPGLKIYW